MALGSSVKNTSRFPAQCRVPTFTLSLNVEICRVRSLTPCPGSGADLHRPISSRTTNARLLSILLIVAVAWIWLTFHEVLHAHVEFSEPLPSSTPTLHRNKHASLPPSHISNVPCKVATVTQTEPLSQTIFPIADLTKNDSWVGENNKMLKALFRCMEMNNCAANQNKGM